MNVESLRGTYLLDTNILIYSFDSTSPRKQQIAQTIVKHALLTKRGVISSQVVQEFTNVALYKSTTKLDPSGLQKYMRAVLLPLCAHFPTFSTYERALNLHAVSNYRWFDALILTAAQELSCATLLSEDMQHLQVINGVTITNPFV